MTDEKNSTTRIQNALNLQEVPQKKWESKKQSLAYGLFIVAVGVLGGIYLEWSEWVTVGFVAVGCVTADKEIAFSVLKRLIPFLREVVNIFRGKE